MNTHGLTSTDIERAARFPTRELAGAGEADAKLIASVWIAHNRERAADCLAMCAWLGDYARWVTLAVADRAKYLVAVHAATNTQAA